MKKFLLSSFVITSVFAFWYTQIDINNANYLSDKWIITSQPTTTGYRLDDTITRAEVAGIALKLRGTTFPEWYICKKYFSDVTSNDWICRAVEMAADAGFVSRTNTTFRPQDKITRAEALSIMIKAGWLSVNNISGYTSGTEGVISDTQIQWQREVFNIGFSLNIINKSSLKTEILTGEMGWLKYYFYPDRDATRAEVFGFAKNILEYKAIMSGEVTLYIQSLIDAKKKNMNTIDTDSRLDESIKK